MQTISRYDQPWSVRKNSLSSPRDFGRDEFIKWPTHGSKSLFPLLPGDPIDSRPRIPRWLDSETKIYSSLITIAFPGTDLLSKYLGNLEEATPVRFIRPLNFETTTPTTPPLTQPEREYPDTQPPPEKTRNPITWAEQHSPYKSTTRVVSREPGQSRSSSASRISQSSGSIGDDKEGTQTHGNQEDGYNKPSIPNWKHGPGRKKEWRKFCLYINRWATVPMEYRRQVHRRHLAERGMPVNLLRQHDKPRRRVASPKLSYRGSGRRAALSAIGLDDGQLGDEHWDEENASFCLESQAPYFSIG